LKAGCRAKLPSGERPADGYDVFGGKSQVGRHGVAPETSKEATRILRPGRLSNKNVGYSAASILFFRRAGRPSTGARNCPV
jgi:hypothetical protein